MGAGLNIESLFWVEESEITFFSTRIGRVNAGKYGRFLHIEFSPTRVLFIPASYNQIPVFILEYCHLEPLAVE